MKIAVLANNYCSGTLETVRHFKNSQKINYVIIETSRRKSQTSNEIIFNKNNILLENMLFPKKQKGLINKLKKKLGEKNIFILIIRIFIQKYKYQKFLNELKKENVEIIKVKKHNSIKTKEFIVQNKIDYSLFLSSNYLIKKVLIDIPNFKIISIHCAILPKNRSLHSMQWSILNGDKTGHTAHFIDEGIDTGPILKSEYIEPNPGENLIELRQRINSMKPHFFLKVIQEISENKITPKKQNIEDGIHHRVLSLDELLKANAILTN